MSDEPILAGAEPFFFKGNDIGVLVCHGFTDLIKGAIPINAAVQLSSPDMAGLAFGRGLPDTVPGIGSDIKDPNSKELAYAEVPVVAFRQVYALMAATHDLLPRVKCPTLVITAREDHVVSPTTSPSATHATIATASEIGK